MKNKEEKKKKHTGTKVVSSVVVLAAIAIYFFGDGIGLGKGNNMTEDNSATAPNSSSISQSVEGNATELALVVTETEIKVNDEVKTIEEIETMLTSGEKYTVILKDEKALKSTFDKIEEILKDNNIEYYIK